VSRCPRSAQIGKEYLLELLALQTVRDFEPNFRNSLYSRTPQGLPRGKTKKSNHLK